MRRPLLVTSLLAVAACGTEPAGDPAALTWHQTIAPIVARSCMGCHQDGGIAPFSLASYEDVVEHAPRMVHAIETGIMPPFYARETEDCTPRHGWRDDPRLSARELADLRAWIAADYPLGTRAPMPAPPATELADATTTLAPTVPWVASGDRDQFVCVVLDPATTELRWLTGLQVRPGNALVVHHVQIDQVEGSAAALLVARHGIGQPFTEACGRMQHGQSLVHLWTPGSQPLDMNGAELALALRPGAKLVMQIHYHPGGRVHDPDTTAVDLRLSDVAPRKRYFAMAIGNEGEAPLLLPSADEPADAPPAFVIPRGVADHVERMSVPLAFLDGLDDVRVVSVSPHMHYLGTQITAQLARGDEPSGECLSNSGWHFDWQRTFTYDAPLAELPIVTAHDRIDITCRYDNTTDNPGVLRMLHDAHLPPVPIDVALGVETTNEMCLETFGVAADL